ncbi:MAG: 2-oxoacid:acceptor oxidoreductase family protein [Thermoleophilia bacterium]|nr:2-oxoacid:acceptor oxidoreductase family protein [Thermoleophilia bacterium]
MSQSSSFSESGEVAGARGQGASSLSGGLQSGRNGADELSLPKPPPRFGLLAKRNYVEVRLGGTGGQGLVLMGVILAEAANLDRRCVVNTESYGPEARGGYSRSDVIISDNPIDYPKVQAVDVLVALSQPAAVQYVPGLKPDGVFIYDSELVTAPPTYRGLKFAVPMTRMAKETTGRVQTTNVVAFGVLVKITGVVSVESAKRAVWEAVPVGTEELNLEAFKAGLAIDPDEFKVE